MSLLKLTFGVQLLFQKDINLLSTKKVGALLGLTWIGPISAMFLYFGFGTIAVIALMNWQTCHIITKLQQSYTGQKNASRFEWNLRYLKRTSHGIMAWYLIGWGPNCLAYGISGVESFNVSSEATLIILLVARSLLILKALTSPFLYVMEFRVIRRALLDMSVECKLLDHVCRYTAEDPAAEYL
ncbi:unnamed protein product [Allacma fusca]|uniref:Opsin n=1 Tax=Allacma fusca TaxID=39272 RepID=A0A8J2LJM2_9HEXA|nr:unnamed protein product [Allacma fusca]